MDQCTTSLTAGLQLSAPWIYISPGAGVVQWQNGSFPSCIRGFDSLHPLQTLPASISRVPPVPEPIAANKLACLSLGTSRPNLIVRRPTGTKMVNLLANIIGALGAIAFVGYFAYKVNHLPLTIIVVICLGLMVYSFYDDLRRDRAISRARRENDRTPTAGGPV